MANDILTPTAVTREILRVLHQKAVFLGTIDKQYDSAFAKTGAKIGTALKIRVPNEYVVSDGPALVTQDTEEIFETLNVTSQKHVGINFTTEELTMSMDDFSKRIITPAVSVLTSVVDNDAYNMYKDVANMVDGDAASITFAHILEGRKNLVDNLAPNVDRCAMLSTQHNLDAVDVLKGLFQDSEAIKKQYREGMMGRTGGLDFYENTHANKHTTGTAAKTTGYVMDGAAQSGATLVIDTGSTTFLKGDVITLASVNSVHPETKESSGVLKKFVVTANSGASATSLAISPSIVLTGARQNVDAGPADSAAIVKVGAGANETLDTSMIYQKEAFTFATADLIMPQGVDFSARENLDGLSIRVVRQYDINNDRLPCRLDILYGYKTVRKQLACRIHADG